MSDNAADRPPVQHGAVEDPGELQTGDHGLNGDLRATMLAALQRSWTDPENPPEDIPDDAATTQDDAAQAAGVNQPDPASSPDPSEDTGDQAGAGGDPPAEGAAPEAGGPPAPTTPDDFSLDEYARQYFGTDLTRDQARELFGVLGGLQQLTPEQRQMLDQTLAGGAPNQYPATTGQPVDQQQAPTQPPPATPPPGLPPRPEDEYEAQVYDRLIAPLAQTFDSRLSTIQQQLAETTQQQQARQQQEYDAQIAATANQWRQSHPELTDGEYDALADNIIRSGTFPALVRAHGSVPAATQAALDQFFWADEKLRSRAIANLASGRDLSGAPDPASPANQQATDAERQRQARANAVAGGGGSTTPRGDQAPIPKTPDARRQAMIQTLAAEGNFQQ